MDRSKKLVSRSAVLALFVLCWVAYFSTYIAKRDFSAAMASMVETKFLTKDLAGLINTLFFISYAAGQLCNGILGDRFPPHRLMAVGLLLSGLCNTAMGFLQDPRWMLPLWALNGYALSMMWPPILRIFCDLLSGETRTRCTVSISTSVSAGTLISYLLCAGEISLWGWRSTFWLAGGWVLLICVLWCVFYPKIQKKAVSAEESEPDPAENTEAPAASGPAPLKTILLSLPVLLLVLPTLIQGVLRDGITSWVPTYITENFQADPAFAVLISTLLPVITLTGVYGARLAQKWLRTEIATVAFFFLLSSAALGILAAFGRRFLVPTVLCFAVIVASMEAINLMIVGLFAMRYGKQGRAATVSGFFNFLTYAGTSVSTYGVGLLADRLGWGAALTVWVCLSAAALALSVFLSTGKRRTIFAEEE